MPHARKQSDTDARRVTVHRDLTGALDLAVHTVLNTEPAWFSETDPAANAVLAAHWPHVPNHGDITTIDWGDVEPVDVLIGGFPCISVSAAGQRAGLVPGSASGLWVHMAHAIRALRPSLILFENVRGLLSAKATHPNNTHLEPCLWCVGNTPDTPLRALGAVLGDLVDLRYDTRWVGLPASALGAPHHRYRIFGAAVPHTQDLGHQRGRDPRPGRTGPPHSGHPPTHPQGLGRGERITQPAGISGRHDARPSSHPAPHPHREGRSARGRMGGPGTPAPGGNGPREADTTDDRWGPYAAAITRWEHTLGRPAPAPTTVGLRGGPKLSPHFVEWMQGLPHGWVTDTLCPAGATGRARSTGLNNALKCLGNTVVPLQAAAAITHLLHGDDTP